MRRILFRVLLSVALIFQGMGSACGYGSMPAGMAAQIQAADHPMAISCADMQVESASGSTPLPHQDCMHLCSMAASLPIMVLTVPPLLLRDTLELTAAVSLVEYVQVPPTPPPIA
jgi:hypothetical protein